MRLPFASSSSVFVLRDFSNCENTFRSGFIAASLQTSVMSAPEYPSDNFANVS